LIPSISPELYDVTEALVNNLLASEAFTSYQQACIRLRNDMHAQSLLKQLSELQSELRQQQTPLSPEDIRGLRSLQEEVQSDAVIRAYLQAQQDAANLLRDVNEEIRSLLGINFATFANHATC
jgi:cell fate (sporulation/competence/biofilm development) regulator YlbF (YheA/YmcA/DUF963 family)